MNRARRHCGLLLGCILCIGLPLRAEAEILLKADFDQETPDAFEGALPAASPEGEGRYLMPADPNLIHLRLGKIPESSLIRVRFDLLIQGSWDGVATSSRRGMRVGPDRFIVLRGGDVPLFSASFSNIPAGAVQNNPDSDLQSYPGLLPGDRFPSQTGGSPISPWSQDVTYDMTLIFQHDGPDLHLLFTSESSGRDERWGIDNLTVETIQAEKLPDATLRDLWTTASAADDPAAREAFVKLLSAGPAARAFIEQELSALAVSDEEYARLIEHLNHPDFDHREAATQRLAGMKTMIQDRLQQSLQFPHPPETRKRLRQIVENEDPGVAVTDQTARKQQIGRRILELLATSK
jgi:uncharacterized protein (DUF1778 family)